MESLYLANATQTQPEVPQDIQAGYPTDGSSTGGVRATVPGAIWYNGVTMEIVNAIRAGGITPDRTNNAQLAASILALIDGLRQELQAQIDELSGNVFAPGAIAFFAMADAPANWLVADGRAVSRTTYSDLFEQIGTTYGAGNGSSTFNLPNLMGRVAWGASTPGESIAAGLPDIVGATGADDRMDGGHISGAFRRGADVDTGSTGSGMGFLLEFKASNSNAIYGRSSTVQPPALKLLPCIHI